jgi:hypothetical protein
MSEENKVVEIKRCELHSIPSYHKADGSVIHTCSDCHPELKNERK